MRIKSIFCALLFSIIGYGNYGKVIPESSYPAIIKVNQHCTATLIHPSVFITATHCLKEKMYISYKGKKIVVIETISHPDFYWTKAGTSPETIDVSLGILPIELDITEKDVPRIIDGQTFDDLIKKKRKAITIGFGPNPKNATKKDKEIMKNNPWAPNPLLKKTLTEVDYRIDLEEDFPIMTHMNLFAAAVTEGDSGSSLLIKNDEALFLSGILSIVFRDKGITLPLIGTHYTLYGLFSKAQITYDFVSETFGDYFQNGKLSFGEEFKEYLYVKYQKKAWDKVDCDSKLSEKEKALNEIMKVYGFKISSKTQLKEICAYRPKFTTQD